MEGRSTAFDVVATLHNDVVQDCRFNAYGNENLKERLIGFIEHPLAQGTSWQRVVPIITSKSGSSTTENGHRRPSGRPTILLSSGSLGRHPSTETL